MNQNRKLSYIFVILLIFSANIIFFSNNSIAATLELDTNYTDEYYEWLSLPEEEKVNVIEPPKYEIRTKNKTNFLSKLLKSYKSSLESKFDLRQKIKLTVKDQKNTDECWAISTLNCLESNFQLRHEKVYDFSERHMDYATSQSFFDGENVGSFSRNVGEGGNVNVAYSYLTNGQGAVSEEEMPFENNENNIQISSIQNKTVLTKVNQYRYFDTIDKQKDSEATIEANREQIKEHIKNYGAVTATIPSKIVTRKTQYYNEEKAAVYCNDNSWTEDHQIAIVGWDDDYAVENFNSNCIPSKKGAWIVENSWGESYGDKGYFYYSYEDIFIDDDVTGIVEASEVDYDNLYQYDYLGSNNKCSLTNAKTAYEAAIFKKKTDGIEKIDEIAFHTWNEQKCKIYINKTGTSLNEENLELVKEIDTALKPGYHTIKLNVPIAVKSDFAVVVGFTTVSNSVAYVSVEASANDDLGWYKNSTQNSGEGYISSSLKSGWHDLIRSWC